MELNERQAAILRAIMTEHIKTAEPVGSSVLVDKYDVDLSPASIRNEMADLEERGYLVQPHTSAGRVPTIKSYRYYLDNFLEADELSKHDQEVIRHAAKPVHDPEQRTKSIAKSVAELCDNTVIVGFARRDVYYTGLSNLFQQPEFRERVTILSLSEVVDRLDEVIANLFDDVSDEPQVLLGRDNPFGPATGALVAKFERPGQLFGILGPMRMPYGHHLAVLRFTKELIDV